MPPQQPSSVDDWAKQFGAAPITAPPAPPRATSDAPRPPMGMHPQLDAIVGAAKGVGTTAVGLGDMLLNVGYPQVTKEGVKWIALADTIDAIGKAAGVDLNSRAKIDEARKSGWLQPSSAAQTGGKTVEQVAEFFLLPTGKVKAGTASVGLIPKIVTAIKRYIPEAVTQGVGAATLTQAQTGSPEDAKVAGVVGTVAPAAGRVAAALPTAIKNAAERNIYRFLAPTKEVTKAEAGRIIPQFLERGTVGTRMSVKEAAVAGESSVGREVSAAERAASAATPGDVVSTVPLRSAMAFMERKALTKNAAGDMVPVVGREAYYNIAKGFREFAEALPDQIPIEQAADLKRQWQAVVTAGKAWDSALPEKMAANIAKRAQAKIRTELLSVAPDLRAVYNEYAYQRGLRDVLAQTVKRTAAHEPGWMKRAWLPATLSGGFEFNRTRDPWMTAAAFVGGSVLGRMMASPYWQTVSGQLKSRLADAIVAGNADDAVRAIMKAVPSLTSEADPTNATSGSDAARTWARQEIGGQAGREPSEGEIDRFLKKYPYQGK